ncbi:MAG TPA: hypothetical protein VKP68_11545, partial [Ramlibacter sp.]|nr:hypothetical protein [Ramlibacter sp.]
MAKLTPADAIAMMATTTSSSNKVKPRAVGRGAAATTAVEARLLLPAADVRIFALAPGLAVGA